jgi:hypothetical protein
MTMQAEFKAACGHIIPALPAGHTGGTGYAERADGSRICYLCAGAEQRAEAQRDGRAVFYLVKSDRDGAPRWVITDWPGTFELPAYGMTHGHGYGFGRRYPIVCGRFTLAGQVWAFRNAGDNQLARCRALMRRGSRVAP